MNTFTGGKLSLELGKRTYIMGILNYTPDSFSDGGVYFSPDAIAEHARALESEGASILDLGVCSTAPASRPVSQEEELLRLRAVLPIIMKNVNTPVSLDTSCAAAARYAAQFGVSVINDESGFFNEEIAAVVKEYGLGWVMMHTGGVSSREVFRYPQGVTRAVSEYFEASASRALDFGIDRSRLCFDVGIGFGKSYEDNLTLLRTLGQFGDYHALLCGTSRKRVVGIACGEECPAGRVYGTVAADTAATAGGADIIRVHDVSAALQGARMADAIFRRDV